MDLKVLISKDNLKHAVDKIKELLGQKQDKLSFPLSVEKGGTGVNTGFALPISIKDNDDLNNYLTPGQYYCNTDNKARACSNCPASRAFNLEVKQWAPNSGIIQILAERSEGATNVKQLTSPLYVRAYYGSATNPWSEWKTVAYTDSIDAILKQLDSINDITTTYNLIRGSRDFIQGTEKFGSTSFYFDGWKYDQRFTYDQKDEEGFTIASVNVSDSSTAIRSTYAINPINFKKGDKFTFSFEVMSNNVEELKSTVLGSVGIIDKTTALYVPNTSKNISKTVIENFESGKWYKVSYIYECSLDKTDDYCLSTGPSINGNGNLNFRKPCLQIGAINNPEWSPNPFDLPSVEDTRKLESINDLTTGINLLRGTRDWIKGNTHPSKAGGVYFTDGYFLSSSIANDVSFKKDDEGYTVLNISRSGATTTYSGTIVSSIIDGIYIKKGDTYTASVEIMIDDIDAFDDKTSICVLRFVRTDGSVVTPGEPTVSLNLPNNIESGKWYTVSATITASNDRTDNYNSPNLVFRLLKNGSVNFRKPLIYKGSINNPVWSPNPFDIVPIESGGTGADNLLAARYNITANLSKENNTMVDSVDFICGFTQPSQANGGIYRRNAANVWNWIAGKIRSVFGFDNDNHLKELDSINDLTTGINLLRGTRDFTTGTNHFIYGNNIRSDYYMTDGWQRYTSNYFTKSIYGDNEYATITYDGRENTNKSIALYWSNSMGSDYEFHAGDFYTISYEVMIEDATNLDFTLVSVQLGLKNRDGSDQNSVVVGANSINTLSTNGLTKNNVELNKWYKFSFICQLGDNFNEDCMVSVRLRGSSPGGIVKWRKLKLERGAIEHPVYSMSPFDVVPIESGGTGATTPIEGRNNLFKSTTITKTNPSDTSSFMFFFTNNDEDRIQIRQGTYVWNWIKSKIQADSTLSSYEEVGSVYISQNETSPAAIYGGTWMELKDTPECFDHVWQRLE